MRRTAPAIAVLLTAVVLTACGDDDDDGNAAATSAPLKIAASFYPLQEAAEAVGGNDVEVTGLTPLGSGPHGLELKPAQLTNLEETDVVVYLGAGFQPAVEKAVGALPDGVTRVDVLDGVQLRTIDAAVPGVRGEPDGETIDGDKDPHVWVDPAQFGEIVDGIEAALLEADPDRAEQYARNADTYRTEIDALNDEFAAGLGNCPTRTLVTSHAAFGYLADRYDLEQAPIAGISPDDEPDPASLAATARKAKADGVQTVFFETLVPKKLSQTVADEIGARTDFLNPVEGLTQEERDEGVSYVTIQRDNLARLKRGLGCTA